MASAVILGIWGYSLLDFRGGLPKVSVASSQTIAADDVNVLHVQAEGIAVEVASSYDMKDIKIQLYGTGYINQQAVWQKDETGRLDIQLSDYPITANAYGDRYQPDLTMRILLPKKSYDEIAVSGQRLDAAFYQCKGKLLTADVAYGTLLLQRADLQRANLYSNTSNISVNKSRIHYLTIQNKEGDTVLFDNKLRYWQYHSIAGDLEVFARKISGIWELNSERGDLHIGTKKWHQNLLLDLHSDQGIVNVSSKKKPWKKTIPAALTDHNLQLLEGHGENMLLVKSETGDITLDTVKFKQ